MKIKVIAILVGALLLPTVGQARDYTFEIRQKMMECANQRASMLYERQGASACHQVKQLIMLQRLEREAEIAEETGQPMPSHDENTVIIKVGE